MSEPNVGEIIVFENGDFGGAKLLIKTDTDDLRKFNFNDKISSVKVGPKTKATLFEHVGYQGRKIELNATTNWIGNACNDIVSSIRIETLPLVQGEIIIFEHANYGGRALFINTDIPDLRRLDFNDIISSVKVGPNTKATLFEHVGYAGKSFELTASSTYVGNVYNDIVSAIRITKTDAAPPPEKPEAKRKVVKQDFFGLITVELEYWDTFDFSLQSVDGNGWISGFVKVTNNSDFPLEDVRVTVNIDDESDWYNEVLKSADPGSSDRRYTIVYGNLPRGVTTDKSTFTYTTNRADTTQVAQPDKVNYVIKIFPAFRLNTNAGHVIFKAPAVLNVV